MKSRHTLKAMAWVLGLFFLSGCGVTSSSQTIHDMTTGKNIQSLPSDLGLLVPQVANYQCGTIDYIPAGYLQPGNPISPSVGMPLWQADMWCWDPNLKENLPKGDVGAGMVYVMESPGVQLSAESLSITGAKNVKLDKLSVIEGESGIGGYTTKALAFLIGKSTYHLGSKEVTRRVVVYLTGRAVPLSVLEKFALSMAPLNP